MQKLTKSAAQLHADAERFECGDPLLAVADGVVVAWNRALAALTGIPPGATLGRPCWEALDGVRPDGARLCGPDCPSLRPGAEPVGARSLLVATRAARLPVVLSTMHVERDGRAVVLHLLHVAHRPGSCADPSPLTPRQLEVLGLVAGGVRPAAIARRLGLAQATVRNHLSEALARLGCHSQLEAVAEARRRGLLSA